MKKQIGWWIILFCGCVGLTLVWRMHRQSENAPPPPSPPPPEMEAEAAIDALKRFWMQGTGDGSENYRHYAIWEWRTNLMDRTLRAIRAVSNSAEQCRLTVRCIETALELPLDIYGDAGFMRGVMLENKNMLICEAIWRLFNSKRRENVERGWHYLIEKTKFVMGEVLECDRRLAAWKKGRATFPRPKSPKGLFSGFVTDPRTPVRSYRVDAIQSLHGECHDLFWDDRVQRLLSVFPPDQRDEMIRQLKVLYEPLSDDEKRYLYLLPQKKVNAE